MKLRLKLPPDSQLEAKVGGHIKLGDPLYTVRKSMDVMVNIAGMLNIGGDQLFRHLTKMIGDSVSFGDVLATKKGIIGTKKIHSEHAGIIAQIDHNSGTVVIAASESVTGSEAESKPAFFSGRIEEFEKAEGTITVTIDKGEEIDLKRASEDGGGELYFFSDESHYFTASEDQIEGKIIVVSELKPHISAKCEALGALGFVYLAIRPDLSVSGAQVEKIADFEALVKGKKKYILYSAIDKKAIIYDNE